jgi:hypothetical protein
MQGTVMNNTIEEVTETAEVLQKAAPMEQQRRFELTLLRWMELKGLKSDHGTFARGFDSDEWWVTAGDEISGLVTFDSILETLLNGHGPVQLPATFRMPLT